MTSTSAIDLYLRRYALCIAALAISLVLFPLLALATSVVPLGSPAWLRNGLFFWPQFLLLPSGFESASSGAVYGATLGSFAAVAFWLALVAAFARLTLAWRKRWMLPALFAAVAVVAELMLLAFRGLGLHIVLDGL